MPCCPRLSLIKTLLSAHMINMTLHATVASGMGRVAPGTTLLGERLKAALEGSRTVASVTLHDVGQRIGLMASLAVDQLSLGQVWRV